MSVSSVEQVQQALDNAGATQEPPAAVTPPAEPTTPAEPQVTEPELSDAAQGFLKDIPEAERPIVEKYVKQWDAGVTQRFQSVHSEYEGWKPLKDAGYDPEEVSQAVALVEALNQDPQGTVKAVAEAYGITLQQAAQAVQEAIAPVTPQQGAPVGTTPQLSPQQAAQAQGITDQQFAQLPPEVQQRLQMVDVMAQLFIQQQQAQEQATADKQLEDTLTALRDKHGDFNDQWVLSLAYQTGDIEGAVQQYKQLEAQLGGKQGTPTPGQPTPTVLGSGGGLPTGSVDVTKLDNKATKDLVKQMLDQANQQG